MKICAPEPLGSQHDFANFSCGENVLDDWLKKRALANQVSGASRVFVVCDENKVVRGYYALAAGAVSHSLATGNVRRNMPDPVPVLVLGRLAVDQQAQGHKLGSSLLQDAVKRALHVAENAGIRALLVHALNDNARQFYEYYGFTSSPIDPPVLMLKLPTHTVAATHQAIANRP